MRILVYGAGVLGCNLANNLYHAKKDVTLLARGVWAKQLKKNGLHMKKTFHLRESVSRVPVITQLEPEDCYDVIFVVVRYTQLDGVMEDLRANGTKNIVLLGNNARPVYYASLFPEKNIMFAFALSAGHSLDYVCHWSGKDLCQRPRHECRRRNERPEPGYEDIL